MREGLRNNYLFFFCLTKIFITSCISERANLDNREPNAYGTSLLELCKACGLRIINGRFGKDLNVGNFTCITGNSCSVIDYILTDVDIFSSIIDFEVKERLESIHLPVCLTLSLSDNSFTDCNRNPVTNQYVSYSRLKFIAEKKDEYVQRVVHELNRESINFRNNIANNSLQGALDTIMTCIYSATECMKTIKTKAIAHKDKSQPWFDSECKLLRTNTLKALRQFRRLQNDESLKTYQHCKKTFRKLTSMKKKLYFDLQTFKLSQACADKDPKTFWNFLKGSNETLPSQISAHEWFNYFSNVYSPDDVEMHEDDINNNDFVADELDLPISNSEVSQAIKRLKNDKSPGLDGVPAEFFKVISEMFVPFLVQLFNKMYDDSFFPEKWSYALISPIHKFGDKNKPENYRGISLQSVLSKIFASILSKRLKTWCEINNVIGEEQAGFRPSRSTIDNIFCLQTIVQKYLRKKGGRLYAAFVDFEKAFDRVDRKLLWDKLNTQHVSSKMVKMLKSMYTSVQSCVKTSTGLTGYFNCPAGVKQGCILSPLLFCLFLNDLQNFLSIGSHGIDLDMCTIYMLLFADDLVLFAESKVELQRLINRLKLYCDTFKLKINLNKTNVMVFRNGGYLRHYEKWFYDNIPLRVVTYYKYLGLVISSRLSWYVCQKTLAEQASKALFAIKSKLSQFGALSSNILFKIFDTKILPILTYGAEIWFEHESKDIEKVHTDFCKYVLKVTKFTPNAFARGELGRYTIGHVRSLKFIKYWIRILKMSNDRFPKICYKLQCKWLEGNPRTNCWVRNLRDLLLAYGFGYAWYNQGVGNELTFLRRFEQKEKDIDISLWFMEVTDMNRLRTYRILKDRFCFEDYLNDNMCVSYKQLFVKFRGGLLDLKANTGRFEGIPYHERICQVCNSDIETEMHFLLECPYYDHLRQEFIPLRFHMYPSEIQFKNLLNQRNLEIRIKTCQYLIQALRLRNTILQDRN